MWPEAAQQAKPRFGQVKFGILRLQKLLALVDPGQLFGLGRQLRLSALSASRTIAHFQLRQHRLELVIRDLLL